MFTAIRNFFSAPHYDDDFEKSQDARTTHRVAIALLGLGLFSMPFTSLLGSPIKEYALYGTVGGMILWLLTISLGHRNQTHAAKLLILTVNTLNLFTVTFATGGLARQTIVTTLFLLALANLLFPRRGAISFGLILLALSTSLFVMGRLGLVPAATIPGNETSVFFIFVFTLVAVASVLAIASANMRHILEHDLESERNLRERNIELNKLTEELEQRVEERTVQLQKHASQLEAIANVARSIATSQNLEELLTTITKVVSERFNFYHVGIFLLNESEDFAVLRAANSAGGQNMLNRGHRLRVGAEGIVGYATGRRKARIALDTGADAAYFDNPDLPDTRSEVALPLSLGDTIIGALDIQSTEPNAFSNEDIASFTVLADQITIAIQNALSIEQAQIATTEAEAISRQLIGQAWSEVNKSEAMTGFHFDGMSIRSLSEPTSSKERNNKMLSIPIQLRNEAIGNLSIVHSEENKSWSKDEIAIFQSVAERIALAAENARLLEASQRQVAKERIISEGATRVSSALDVESILQATAEELERTLGDSDIIIQLESEV